MCVGPAESGAGGVPAAGERRGRGRAASPQTAVCLRCGHHGVGRDASELPWGSLGTNVLSV